MTLFWLDLLKRFITQKLKNEPKKVTKVSKQKPKKVKKNSYAKIAKELNLTPKKFPPKLYILKNLTKK